MSRTDEIAKLYSQYVMPTYAQRLAIVRGKGTRVWDADGKVYLDFMSGIAVLNVGHCHPKVVAAVQKQAETLSHCSNIFYNEVQAKLAAKLSGLSLRGKCFFCNSGAEANEGMIKLARLWGHDSGRYEIICMKNSFHGRTLATAAATGQEKIQKGFDPLPTGFCHAPFNDLESVRALVNEKTVAVMLEAVQGEGGVIPADEAFIQGVRELCNEKNLLMLCDEVQCGMGRTGHWFAVQGYGVDPDAFSLAKSLGNGCPIGAVVSGPKLADVFQPGRHASTFGGNPLACAAALATLEVIEEEGLVERAQRTGELFIEGLKMFAESFPDQVETARGRGLMLGMVLRQPAKPFVDTLADMGLLSLATAENVVRFLPPLNVKDNELEEALDIISDGLTGCPADEPVEEPAPAAETAEAPAEEEPAVGAAPAEPEATPGEGAQS